MEHVPHSTSFPYVPVDGSLSMVKETGKEEALLRQGELETKGGIPPGFKGKVLNLSDCMRIALEVSPETKATWQAVRSAAARVGEEKSACLPSADFSAAAARQKQVSSQSLQSGQPRVQ
jgi:hypothetical protein